MDWIIPTIAGSGALILGGAGTWLWLRSRLAVLRGECRALAAAAEDAGELRRRNLELEKQLAVAERAIADRDARFARERELAVESNLRENAAQSALNDERLRAAVHAHRVETEALRKELELLRTHDRESRDDLEKNWNDKLALLREEFKTVSARLLEERAETLKAQAGTRIAELLEPLKQKMEEFKSTVAEARDKGIEMNSALRRELEKMFEATRRIGSEANGLALALRGDNKTQGNWGEMILEKILENSGLVAGVHYEVQPVLRDDDGKPLRSEESDRFMRPDVIVRYPDGRDVILDSKVSLTAYTDYVNAEDDGARGEALARHLKSVRTHVDELARKNYSAYLRERGRETIDFVILFIPNEAPHQLAMLRDPGLWSEAFERKVLIVSPVNLTALLRIIQLAWNRADQERNRQLILDTAARLLDRVYHFYEAFDDVGRKLEEARRSYADATLRLKAGDGRHSVVGAGEKLRMLGVKMKKPRPLPGALDSGADTPDSAENNGRSE